MYFVKQTKKGKKCSITYFAMEYEKSFIYAGCEHWKKLLIQIRNECSIKYAILRW